MIADTARIHQARVHWLTAGDELLEELRVLGGHDDDLAHDRTRTANRLRDMLLQTAPAVERVLGPRLEHPAVRALLERYPTPSAMRTAGKRRLLRLVQPRAPRMGVRLIDELFAALDAQTVTVPAEQTIGRVIRDLAAELSRLAAARERLATEIEAVFVRHPQAPVLLSIPGIGARTGARILTEIGDVTRFPTAGHLAAYAGLAPGHQAVRPLDQRRAPLTPRQPPTQERALALIVLLAAPRPLPGLLRPQARRRQEAQRRDPLPRPAPLRPHPQDAQHRPQLRRTAGKTGTTPPSPANPRLNPLTNP